MDLIRHRSVQYVKAYSLHFTLIGAESSGFCFECDPFGAVDIGKLNPCALDSYKKCREGKVWRLEDVHYYATQNGRGDTEYRPVLCTGRWVERQVSHGDVQERDCKVVTPGAVRCGCGEEVELHGFTNTCECGCDYNMSGSLLAPREQWGEETGESLSDILSIG